MLSRFIPRTNLSKLHPIPRMVIPTEPKVESKESTTIGEELLLGASLGLLVGAYLINFVQ